MNSFKEKQTGYMLFHSSVFLCAFVLEVSGGRRLGEVPSTFDRDRAYLCLLQDNLGRGELKLEIDISLGCSFVFDCIYSNMD